MEIILLKDVPNLGAANALVTVKDGYASNYLIPKGFAQEASLSNRRQWQNRLRAERIREERMAAALAVIIEKLQKSVVRVPVKVGAHGSLFGSVTSIQLVREIKAQLDVALDRKQVRVPENATRLGVYEGEIDFSSFKHAEPVVYKFELVAEEAAV